jgi:molecular chaperone HtpG
MSKIETHNFETEIDQLMDLMVHSLYSQKEIFLRELISNSSDAIDKLRFQAVTDETLLGEDELAISIDIDKEARTLTLSDNGIGMNREEVVENIGTIARSGTKKFVEALSGDEKADSNLIGQFGVGFYSVFMVADEVTLVSRKAGDDDAAGTQWKSSGKGAYTLEDAPRERAGTSITLHLRKDEDEFLEDYRLRSIISKYSDHIDLPIKMKAEEEYETVNSATALWARAKNEISKEEYENFYQSLSYDTETPFSTLHHKVEGNLEYTSLLFIPSKAPFDLWNREQSRGLKLYVRRVFILDDAEQLLPSYLRFVRGIVDCNGLPLNVSREVLQHNRDIEKIKAGIVKRVLTEIKRLAKDEPETFTAFWKEFGTVLKEGVVEDMANREAIAEILRYATTHDDVEGESSSLDDYISRMPEDQTTIYYVSADTPAAAAGSPHLEIFKKKGIEVLLMGHPIDEWVVSNLTEYKEKTLQSVAKGELDNLKDEEDSESKDQEKELKPVLKKLGKVLEDKVKEVRFTNRLTDSPACLVADENDMGANLERILKAAGQDAPTSKPILEINPGHELIKNLNPRKKDFEDWAQVLFDQAALSEGAPIADPAGYVKRVNRLLSK